MTDPKVLHKKVRAIFPFHAGAIHQPAMESRLGQGESIWVSLILNVIPGSGQLHP